MQICIGRKRGGGLWLDSIVSCGIKMIAKSCIDKFFSG